MTHDNERRDEDGIDLGSVVAQTKGAVSGSLDAITLPKNRQGIADD